MTHIKTAHGDLVAKTCCVPNEIKCLKTNWFSCSCVHTWKEGGLSFPLGLFSTPVAYTTEILPSLCSLPHSLSSRSDWDSPKPMSISSVLAKDTRRNTKSKAKTTICHLSCFAGTMYSLLWFIRESKVSWKLLLESMTWDATTGANRKLWQLQIWSLQWSAIDVPFIVSTIPSVPIVCRAFS